ncbi:hypothetical protein FOZ63_023473, partial [Perkinsus olseni]
GFLVAKKCPDYANGVSTLRALQSTFYENGRVVSWLKSCGIRWYQTPPRCERAHGWYETLHKTFLQIVRALLLGDQSRTLKWFDVIDRAAWTINQVYRHSADSDIFPAELHFCYGRALPPNYDDRLARRDFRKFAVGDYVVRYNFNRRGKLDTRWLVDQVCEIVAISGSVATLKVGTDWEGRPVLKSEFLGNLKVVPRDAFN